ncbi:Hypothetical predicted protein, partial [Marmota monax]
LSLVLEIVSEPFNTENGRNGMRQDFLVNGHNSEILQDPFHVFSCILLIT